MTNFISFCYQCFVTNFQLLFQTKSSLASTSHRPFALRKKRAPEINEPLKAAVYGILKSAEEYLKKASKDHYPHSHLNLVLYP